MVDATSESRESFRHSEAVQDQFKRMLDHAVFAPSGHNTQPWLFRLGADHLDLIADRTRGLAVVDPFDRELTISCGAALDHLVTAGRHYGKNVTIELSPDSNDADLLARCRIADAVTPNASDNALFESIPHRRTTRSKFENRELPEDVSERCIELAEQLGVELTLITDSAKRSEIAELVAEGDRIQFADPRFRRELASWVHSRRGSGHDGMSGAGFGMPDILSPIGALVIRTFDLGNGIAAGDKEKIAEGSPTLAVFSSPSDNVGSLVGNRAGTLKGAFDAYRRGSYGLLFKSSCGTRRIETTSERVGAVRRYAATVDALWVWAACRADRSA